jgi:hypothetical protein
MSRMREVGWAIINNEHMRRGEAKDMTYLARALTPD